MVGAAVWLRAASGVETVVFSGVEPEERVWLSVEEAVGMVTLREATAVLESTTWVVMWLPIVRVVAGSEVGINLVVELSVVSTAAVGCSLRMFIVRIGGLRF